jgi:hypothetical protein
MTQWEYLREVVATSTVSPQLDREWEKVGDLGALGWELTARKLTQSQSR